MSQTECIRALCDNALKKFKHTHCDPDVVRNVVTLAQDVLAVLNEPINVESENKEVTP